MEDLRMVKQKKSIVLMARVLVLALLIGVFASVPSEQTFAAANKALRSKVVFNGDKESDAAWMNNNYVMQAGYKKASKIKKNMKMSAKVYVPAAALKKNGDTVIVDAWINLENSKNGKYAGEIGAKYQVILSKEGKKIRLALVDLVKEKECKPGKIASYKKSGKYYVITINNMPLKNTVYKDEKTSKINTKTKYNLGQGIGVTGICTKTSGYVYVDDLKISGVTTQKITFNKKDYKWYSGWHLDKNYSLRVITIK